MGTIRYLVALVLAGCAAIEAPSFDGYTDAHMVNNIVNTAKNTGAIKYTDRPKRYIPTEITRAGGSGNCLDFAVLKCHMLAQTLNPDRLSIWAYTRWDGAGHAVCVIDGRYAIDWTDKPINFDHTVLNNAREYNIIGIDWKKRGAY